MNTNNLPTVGGSKKPVKNSVSIRKINQNEPMNDEQTKIPKKVTFKGKQIIDVESYKIYNQDEEAFERIYQNMQRMSIEKEKSDCCCFIF